MRIYIKNKNNFENFLILIFAIIFIIFSIVISAIYGTEGLMAIIVLLTICCFGIKCDRSEWKDKSGKKKKK